MKSRNIKEVIKDSYSKVAGQQQQSCCGGSACCGGADPSTLARSVGYSPSDLELIPRDASLGLGCGSPIAFAELREGEIVLDLGSGAGMDVFLASNKVGSAGKVIGVDMTTAMVERATSIAKKNNYANVEFRLGEIEKLPVESDSIDAVISNCVINLSPDKAAVFQGVFRALKPGGRIVVSDIVTEGELPPEIKSNPDMWAGCVAGALEQQAYLGLIRAAGFSRLEVLSNSASSIVDTNKKEIGGLRSITVKAFKPR